MLNKIKAWCVDMCVICKMYFIIVSYWSPLPSCVSDFLFASFSDSFSPSLTSAFYHISHFISSVSPPPTLSLKWFSIMWLMTAIRGFNISVLEFTRYGPCSIWPSMCMCVFVFLCAHTVYVLLCLCVHKLPFSESTQTHTGNVFSRVNLSTSTHIHMRACQSVY